MYQIQTKVLKQIRKSLCTPETGGILGVSFINKHLVIKFYYDSTGKTEENTYTPDIESLNKIIIEWAEQGIEFIGFVHSHPNDHQKLSMPDIEYANKIKKSCKIPQILMIIYLPEKQEFYQYVL